MTTSIMTTPQIDAYWFLQQEIVQNFADLLKENFSKADELIASDDNFDNVITYNACYTLYQQHLAQATEAHQEDYLTQYYAHD